jgi:hypothetical protein
VHRVATEAELGEGTAGVWTTAQARASGVSEGTIARRVASGQWQSLRRGTYADGGVDPTPVMRGWAAVLSRGGPGAAWAAGRTTARLLGLPLVDDDDPATGARDLEHDDLAVRARRPGTAGTLHVSRLSLRPADTVLVDGCPSLTLARALPGLAGVLTPEALVCVLDAALHRELITAEALAEVVAGAAARRHVVALRTGVARADGRAESAHETLLRLVLLSVLPGLVPQVELFDDVARLVARFDLGDEALRFAAEADGKEGHAGAEMVAKDRRRDWRTERYGWTTERFTWFDVRRREAETRQRALDRASRSRPGARAA